MRHISYGFLGYPISQAADILIVRAHLVPVGADQLPHVEQTREIARTFNGLFKEVLPVPEALVGEVPRLPGLDGQKMGKSLGNAIFLKDPAPEIRRKIMSAITDPARIKATDPGHPEVCNIYQYQFAFNPEKTTEIESACRRGKVGCVACKRMISEAVIAYLQPIQERRAYYQNKTAFLKDVIRDGNSRTRKEANTTMSIVRQAMHFDYNGLLCA